ncbi:MAG TPA: methyltransferase [Terriglobia bacterium]|nr:methyltransferase [Terriglobia bacterium]
MPANPPHIEGARDTSTELTPYRIMETSFGFASAKTLLSAIELGVFTELGRGALDAESLIQRLGLHPRAARDFFDALVALGMLERHDGRYSNAPEPGYYLDRAKPSYIGGLLEMANMRLYSFWGSLTQGLRTGKPQNEIKGGQNIFDAIYPNPFLLRLFLSAMTGFTLTTAKVLARKFPWRDYQTFLDVGTAQGAVPVEMALAHPHLTGGGFDLAPVGPLFDEYVASFGLSERLRFCPGDFFKDPLPSADVAITGRILHDWNLEEKRALISKIYQTLPQGGAYIVCEMLIDDDRRENVMALLMSLNMLIETPGGFDFTGHDCCGWMRDAGFRETRVEHLIGADWMVVGIK